MKTLPILVATALCAAVPAFAAEPSSGTLSSASPTVTWTGTAPGYGVTAANILITAGGGSPVCEAPACDTFALELAEAAPSLTVTARTDSGNFIDLEVVKPDGSTVFAQSVTTEEDSITIKVKNAPAGAYTLNIWTNDDPASGGGYSASASIATAAAAAPPAPGATPGPAPAPGATPAPAPTPAAPATTITVRTKSASARRVKRKLALAVSSSGPVTNVVASLFKGKKKLATGRLARLSGSGKVTLKLKRKLKPGRYTVGVYGKDAKGGTVGGTTRLAVKR